MQMYFDKVIFLKNDAVNLYVLLAFFLLKGALNIEMNVTQRNEIESLSASVQQ